MVEDDLDISVAGFEPAEIDALHADFEDGSEDLADELDDSCLDGQAVTEFGDLWQLGKHRLMCGDARSSDDLTRLLDGKRAHMAFLDPPYNVAVGSVVGRGAVKHNQFAMASGEMSRDAFIAFLMETMGAAAKASIDGALIRNQPILSDKR